MDPGPPEGWTKELRREEEADGEENGEEIPTVRLADATEAEPMAEGDDDVIPTEPSRTPWQFLNEATVKAEVRRIIGDLPSIEPGGRDARGAVFSRIGKLADEWGITGKDRERLIGWTAEEFAAVMEVKPYAASRWPSPVKDIGAGLPRPRRRKPTNSRAA